MIALIVLSIFSNGNGDAWERFVTVEDECAFDALLLYATYYMLKASTQWLTSSKSVPTRPNTVNSIMGILALVCLCYYSTMDNPYTIIVTLIISSRLMYKLENLMSSTELEFVDDIIADSVVVAILIYTGIIPQYNHDYTIVGLYAFQGICISIAVTKIVLHMKNTPV
jgi:hypothetical protein